MKSFSLLFAIVLFVNTFSSCKKDILEPNSDADTTEEPTSDVNSNATSTILALAQNGNMNSDSTNFCDCFALFDNVDWDASEAEIMAQLETILSGLSEEEVEAMFTPVCTPDGEVFENACVAECNGATNFEECDFDDLCDEYDEFDDICFDLVYPVNVLLPDGTTTSANSDDELEDIFEEWYFNNPASSDEPQLVYPFDTKDEDGNITTVNDDDALEALLETCFDDDDDIDFEECFTFVYPVTIVFPDGTNTPVNNDDELFDTIEDWYESNPSADEDPTLAYPVNVVLAADSTTATINSDDELEDLLDDCYEFDFEECFTFVFPFDLAFPDGTTTTVNSFDEIDTAVETWYTANPDNPGDILPVFPINVTLEDGTTETIEDIDELDELFEECYGDMGGCLVMKNSETALTQTAIRKKK